MQVLEEIPVPEFKTTHTQYSLAWVLSQIRPSQIAMAVQLQDFSMWIQDNQHNLPQTMPPPEAVCQDLSAAGHALYLPNKKDPPKSWLVLDLPGILHDVYGTLFSQYEEITNHYGLIHCSHLGSLFPRLDMKLVKELLISLEFCIPVHLSVLNLDMRKFVQSEDTTRWLLFPALITANFRPPANIPENATQESLSTLCWQLQTSEKHAISAHVAQTILLRLLAHFVVPQGDGEDSQQHYCNIWCNGIVWQSNKGVDISVHITDNRVIQCIGRSNTLSDLSYQYVTDVICHILSTIRQLSPNLAAAAYVVHSPKMTTMYEAAVTPLPQEMFPVEGIRNSIGSYNDYMLSCADTFGHSTRLLISELFGGWKPSQKDVERLLWTYSGPTHIQSTAEQGFTSLEVPTSTPTTPLSTPTAIFHRSLSMPFGAQALLDTSDVPIWSDVNELIVTHVAARWQELASTLGVKSSLVDAVSKNHQKSCNEACQDMLKHWLREEKHTGKQERTWSTLLTALGQADFSELERNLRRQYFEKH